VRLNKLTVGSSKESPTHRFKNLKDVTVDFDEEHWVTVVIGWNGTGKSNVLEAIAVIFRDLIGGVREPAFAYRLAYRMGTRSGTRHIHIDADPDRSEEPFLIHIATDDEARGVGSLLPHIDDESLSALRGKAVRLSTFLKEESETLPRYVFGYYSGESPRLKEVFRPYLERYERRLRNGEDPGLKRLFYAEPVHSQFVLLAFLIQQTEVTRDFLDKHLGLNSIEGVESVLFVLREPPWKSKAPDGDPRFWNARGVVRNFLARLHDIALAPIEVRRRVTTSKWNTQTLQFKYLFVKNMESLRALVGNQAPASFFRDLESAYVSELIDEVRIRVRLRNSDGTVTFRELSEGEQQLLAVLGLLRFTSGEESLFLLDEPDTHLNPRWSADYLKYLQDFVTEVGATSSSHVVFTTHNPLAIAELVREQVQILLRDDSTRQVQARRPEFDPRGMGYAGIVTSDMFGLASTLDSHTQALLEDKRLLTLKEKALSESEMKRLAEINQELDRYGFKFSMRDPVYEEYLRARYASEQGEGNKEVKKMPTAQKRARAKKLIEAAAKKVKQGQGSDDAAR
jgi:predicted ATPase